MPWTNKEASKLGKVGQDGQRGQKQQAGGRVTHGALKTYKSSPLQVYSEDSLQSLGLPSSSSFARKDFPHALPASFPTSLGYPGIFFLLLESAHLSTGLLLLPFPPPEKKNSGHSFGQLIVCSFQDGRESPVPHHVLAY